MQERTASIIKQNGHTYRIPGNSKIEKVVRECVTAMSELTIEESKEARRYLNRTLEDMYKRSPDTVIGTIQPRQ